MIAPNHMRASMLHDPQPNNPDHWSNEVSISFVASQDEMTMDKDAAEKKGIAPLLVMIGAALLGAGAVAAAKPEAVRVADEEQTDEAETDEQSEMEIE